MHVVTRIIPVSQADDSYSHSYQVIIASKGVVLFHLSTLADKYQKLKFNRNLHFRVNV